MGSHVVPALLLVLCIEAQAGQEGSAIVGQAADVTSTYGALAQGATEANPLGPGALLIAKPFIYGLIKRQPKEDQANLFSIFGTAGWAAAANNVCVIASGGLCGLVGLIAGIVSWKAGEAEREYWELCKRVKHREPKEMEC